jgi:hypothetical protein
MTTSIIDQTDKKKGSPIIVQVVTLQNTNKNSAASGLFLEMLGYDDLEYVSSKVGPGLSRHDVKMTGSGSIATSNVFSIAAGKSVTIAVKYMVGNCPQSDSFNFYALLAIEDGGDECYKYTPLTKTAMCRSCQCQK